MTRRDWWLGVALLTSAILLHAMVPRYEWRNIGPVPGIRVDRWTGRAMRGSFISGQWVPSSNNAPDR